MLTGLEASVDSKANELITAIRTLADLEKNKGTELAVGYYPLLFNKGVLSGFGQRVPPAEGGYGIGFDSKNC